MAFQKKLYSRKFFIANLIILGVIIGFVFAYMGGRSLGGAAAQNPALPTAEAETPAVQVTPEIGAALSQAEAVQTAFRYVATTVLPSVVELDVVDKVSETPKAQPSIPFEFFFGPQDGEGQPDLPKRGQEGLGSGVIVRRDGKTVYVLTNDHVAGKAEKITIIMSDGREFAGSLVGTDERKDIALVKFETNDPDIVIARLGDSSRLRVGDWAIALGSPLGLVSSVTAGIVSAIGRDGGPDGNINDFIQTDAAINQGNSGGALANIRGEVIGINTWIATQTGGSVGLGFAIPINNVKSAIDDFIQHKGIRYGWLGVSLLNIGSDKATAKELGIEGKKGAFIAHVYRNGPAYNGGILPGDFITSIGGTEIKSQDELVRKVGDIPAGTTTAIDVIRGGKKVSLKVKIDLRDKNVASNNKDLFPGLSVISLASESIDATKVPEIAKGGIAVTDVVAKSPASVMGVKAGDIITKVNDKKVEGLIWFYQVLNDPEVKKLSFTVIRDEQTVDTLAFNKN
ncbi:MAG: serine protease [Spirochaetae bacterium HGW-Spirochaetae-9]|nr:MAG: serine protease [Spirochaetae bacterium HGW-Spirochaetae-9]